MPESGIDGKVKHDFVKIPINKFDSIEELIIKSRDKGLEFIVVDGNSELLKDLRKDSTKFDYLEKVFDYNKIDENNEFSIFKIDYDLFDLRT